MTGLTIGDNAVGTFTETNGTVTVGSGGVVLANNAGSAGTTFTVNGGTLNSSAALTAGVRANNTVNIGGTGSATFGGSGVIAGVSSVTNAFTTTFNLSGTGLLRITGTDFDLGNGSNAATIFNQTGGTLLFTGSDFMGMANIGGITTLNLSGGTFTSQNINLTLGTRNTATLNISGTAVVTLPGLNMGHTAATTGTKTVNLLGGILNVGSINNGSSLTTTILNLNGGTIQAKSATANLIATNLTAINVRNGGAVIDTNGFNVSFAAVLPHSTVSGDATTDGGFTKLGTRTMTINAVNTFNGPVAVKNGTLDFGVATAIPATATVTLGDGVANTSGVLELDGRSTTLGGLVSAGTGTGNAVVNGNVTALALTLNLPANVTNTFGGTLGGAGTNENNFMLTMAGSGTQVLSGPGTYIGSTNVTGGTLLANNVIGTSSGFVSVAGGTLGGTGTYAGNVSVASSVNPGTPTSAGTLTVGTLAFSFGGGLTANVTNSGADELLVAGTADLTNAALTINDASLSSPTLGSVLTILSAAGGLSNTFNGYADGSLIQTTDHTYTIHYTATDVTLTVGPAARPIITSPNFAVFTVGSSGSFAITATGVPDPSISLGNFVQPPLGLNFNNSGVISGTPFAGTSGVYTYLVTASNSVDTATQTFTIFINPLSTFYVSGSFAGMTVGQFIPDADSGTTGSQAAIFGTSAFATIADALTAANGSGTIVVNAGTYAESPQVTGTATLQLAGNVTVRSIDSTSTATVDLQGFTLTTGDATGDNTLAGPVIGFGGGLIKAGSDVLTLSGTDTYSGPTTVSAGSLLVSGSLTSAVSVATGATLAGSGTVGNVSSLATNSGIVSPGTSSANATLSVGNFVLGSGTLTLNLDGMSSYDSIKASGPTIDLTNTNLTLAITPIHIGGGDQYTILRIRTALRIVGTFVGRRRRRNDHDQRQGVHDQLPGRHRRPRRRPDGPVERLDRERLPGSQRQSAQPAAVLVHRASRPALDDRERRLLLQQLRLAVPD